MHKAATAITILLVLSIGTMAQEQKRGPSTQEERARAIKIAQALEARPADESLRGDYTWLLGWAVEVPDLSVSICTANMPWKHNFKYSGDLAAVGLSSTVAFVIEHPVEGKDAATAGIAAMESMLRAYQKIVEQDPKAHSKEMDEVIEIQKQGKLIEYVRGRWGKTCKS